MQQPPASLPGQIIHDVYMVLALTCWLLNCKCNVPEFQAPVTDTHHLPAFTVDRAY